MSAPLSDLIGRLERERLEADRRYNEALTRVDQLARPPADLPGPPPLFDETLLPVINERWPILPVVAPDLGRGLKGRVRRLIWRMVAPVFERQQAFNAALVDHLNRNVEPYRGAGRAIAALRDAIGAELSARAAFEAGLIQYLQTITAYVDTKDRALGGPALREQIALANERSLAVKRELARLSASAPPSAFAPQDDQGALRRDSSPQPPAPSLSSYVGFEDRFRGSRDEIRGRLTDYLPLFDGASNVLDVGCGRGELLELLKAKGVSASGIDANDAMVAACRERGLDALRADALSHLRAQADGSLGGLTAIQVVEHFEPAYLQAFLEAAYHALKPGAPLVLETINAACWMAFFETYIRDLTHARPLHPETLKFLVDAAGFTSVDVQFRAPVGDGDRLPRVPEPPADAPEDVRALARTLNAHADALNARIFGYMDYAVIARR